MPDRPAKLEIRIDDRIIYAQTVTAYSVEYGSADLMLTAKHNLPPNPAVDAATGTPIPGSDETLVQSSVLTIPDNPLLPPAPSPGAPDGDDEQGEPADPVLQRVHTGDRDPEAEEQSARTRRANARKAAAENSTDETPDGSDGTETPDQTPDPTPASGDGADPTAQQGTSA